MVHGIRLRTGVLSLLGPAAAAALMFASPIAAAAVAPAGHPHSPSFAGYQVGDVPKTGTATFALPTLTCTSTNAGMVAAVQFTNFTTSEFTTAGVAVQCINGTPSYGSVIQINDHYSYLTQTLSAGDVMRVNISLTATATTVSITDTTNHSTVKGTVSGPGGVGSFTGTSVGDIKVGTGPIPAFSTLTFTGVKVNGAPLGAGGTLFPSDMYDATTLQIQAGNLTATGTQFKTTFFHT